MTDEILVEDRLISGTGLLRIPSDLERVYYFSVLVDVIRPPSKIFLSNRYSPVRQRYATVTFLKDGYVLEENAIDYSRRRFDLVLDLTAQVLLAVKCAYEGVLISFVSQNLALGLEITRYTDLVKPMESLNLIADSLQFQCEFDTALQVRLFYRQMITCDEESVKQPKPPPPPAPLPPLSPGTPIGNISPPYNDGDDVTNPSPIDETTPPEPELQDLPFGEDCEMYRIDCSMTDTDGNTQIRDDVVYGPIEEFYFNPSSISQDGKESILLRCRGLAFFQGAQQPCIAPVTYVMLQRETGEYVSHRIGAITPYVP